MRVTDDPFVALDASLVMPDESFGIQDETLVI